MTAQRIEVRPGYFRASWPTAAAGLIRDELGLDVTAGALLAVDWIPADHPGIRRTDLRV